LTRQRDGVAVFPQLDDEMFSALYSGRPMYARAPTAGSREQQDVQAARRRTAGCQEMGGEKNRQKQSRGDLSLQVGPVFRPIVHVDVEVMRGGENT
jgi:hypothetical protein